MPIGVERRWRVDLEPANIASKCLRLRPTSGYVPNPHDVAPRFEPNPNDRLHDGVGISCQGVNELKLLAIRSVQKASAKSRLA